MTKERVLAHSVHDLFLDEQGEMDRPGRPTLMLGLQMSVDCLSTEIEMLS